MAAVVGVGVLGCFLLSVLLGAPAAGSVTSRRLSLPASIDGSGRSDVTAALEAFLQAVPDGTTVDLGDHARYRVEGGLVLDEAHDLTIEGNGSRLFATSRGDLKRSHVVIRGGSGIAVRDLVIQGANPDAGLDDEAYRPELEGQHGLRLEGAQEVELDRVVVSDVYGDFVYLGRREADRRWSEDVWIHDSTFTRNGRQGIAITSARHVVIERNIITDTRRSTIDLEPNSRSGGAEDVHILGNWIGPGRLLFVAAHGNGPVNEVVVAGNDLRGHLLSVDVAPPTGDRRRDFYIVGNHSDRPATRTQLKFRRIDGLVVVGNQQRVTRRAETGVVNTDVCSVTIADNDFGPGTAPLLNRGARCGAPPSAAVPAPPALAGRRGSAAATTTASTTATPPGPAPHLPDSVPAAGHWPDVAAAVAVVVGAALTLALVVRLRSARRP